MARALYCLANTKHKCEEIWGYLAADGHRVGLLTGDVAQKKRLSFAQTIYRGELDILCAPMLQRVDYIFQT